MNYTKSGKFLYTDGHDVDVTASTLRVKSTFYYLKGISDFGIAIVKPNKLPALFMIILGLVLMINVFTPFIPISFFNNIGIFPFHQLVVSFIFIALGASLFFVLRMRYALRIETAEGNKEVLISKNAEYIKQITEAIRRAHVNTTSKLHREGS